MEMKEIKPWLVDVPVRTNIWIRPKCQREQFEVIKKARPRILFVKSDGGRNEEEWRLINENRKIYDTEIDWDCQVYRQYETENLGLYASGLKSTKEIWSIVDRCIFIEDDDIPSVSFFQFCADMLEKYKDDYRINSISGNNPLGIWNNPEADYFFSRMPSIHGIATWRRTDEKRTVDFQNINMYYRDAIIALSKEDKSGESHHIKNVFKTGIDRNHVVGTEFYHVFDRYAYGQLYITPTHNLIKNIGYGDDAEHSGSLKVMPRVVRKYLFHDRTYEYDFPLKEPKFMVRDIDYEKKITYILGIGHPVLTFFRNLEKLWLAVIYGDWKRIAGKVDRVINKRIEK